MTQVEAAVRLALHPYHFSNFLGPHWMIALWGLMCNTMSHIPKVWANLQCQCFHIGSFVNGRRLHYDAGVQTRMIQYRDKEPIEWVKPGSPGLASCERGERRSHVPLSKEDQFNLRTEELSIFQEESNEYKKELKIIEEEESKKRAAWKEAGGGKGRPGRMSKHRQLPNCQKASQMTSLYQPSKIYYNLSVDG